MSRKLRPDRARHVLAARNHHNRRKFLEFRKRSEERFNPLKKPANLGVLARLALGAITPYAPETAAARYTSQSRRAFLETCSHFISVVASASAPSLSSTPKTRRGADGSIEAPNVHHHPDDWGLATDYGKTDAAAVFGTDFARRKTNFKP